MTIYDFTLVALAKILGLLQKSPLKRLMGEKTKFSKFVNGQYGLLDHVCMAMAEEKRQIFWFHASSLGEYNIARPIMERIKSNGYAIVLTFFSPTGVEALSMRSKEYTKADYVFYLPLDTRDNAERFLNIVHPVASVFLVSEYWPNYYLSLKERNIPLYLISSVIHKDSYLMKWYGAPLRKALSCVTRFMVLDKESEDNLNQMGYCNVTVCGDPLFDNAIAISNEPYHNDIIDNFRKTTSNTFIAGSIHNDKDLALISELANKHQDTKFIIVPHEISEEILNMIKYHVKGYCVLYSECDEQTNFTDKQVLVIDFLGSLSRIYRYGTWAYVGGGFTPYLHSVIEATVYGLPVAFGPNINRKAVAKKMITLGIGSSVKNAKELNEWFVALKNNQQKREKINKDAKSFVEQNRNATEKVINIIIPSKHV